MATAIPRVWRDEDPLAGASYRMTCVIEYLDGKGRTTRRLLLEHHREARGGRMVEALVRAEEDGRDVTERQRNEEAKARHEEGRKADRWSIAEAFEPLRSPTPSRVFAPNHGRVRALERLRGAGMVRDDGRGGLAVHPPALPRPDELGGLGLEASSPRR